MEVDWNTPRPTADVNTGRYRTGLKSDANLPSVGLNSRASRPRPDIDAAANGPKIELNRQKPPNVKFKKGRSPRADVDDSFGSPHSEHELRRPHGQVTVDPIDLHDLSDNEFRSVEAERPRLPQWETTEEVDRTKPLKLIDRSNIDYEKIYPKDEDLAKCRYVLTPLNNRWTKAKGDGRGKSGLSKGDRPTNWTEKQRRYSGTPYAPKLHQYTTAYAYDKSDKPYTLTYLNSKGFAHAIDRPRGEAALRQPSDSSVRVVERANANNNNRSGPRPRTTCCGDDAVDTIEPQRRAEHPTELHVEPHSPNHHLDTPRTTTHAPNPSKPRAAAIAEPPSRPVPNMHRQSPELHAEVPFHYPNYDLDTPRATIHAPTPVKPKAGVVKPSTRHRPAAITDAQNIHIPKSKLPYSNWRVVFPKKDANAGNKKPVVPPFQLQGPNGPRLNPELHANVHTPHFQATTSPRKRQTRKRGFCACGSDSDVDPSTVEPPRAFFRADTPPLIPDDRFDLHDPSPRTYEIQTESPRPAPVVDLDTPPHPKKPHPSVQLKANPPRQLPTVNRDIPSPTFTPTYPTKPLPSVHLKTNLPRQLPPVNHEIASPTPTPTPTYSMKPPPSVHLKADSPSVHLKADQPRQLPTVKNEIPSPTPTPIPTYSLTPLPPVYLNANPPRQLPTVNHEITSPTLTPTPTPTYSMKPLPPVHLKANPPRRLPAVSPQITSPRVSAPKPISKPTLRVIKPSVHVVKPKAEFRVQTPTPHLRTPRVKPINLRKPNFQVKGPNFSVPKPKVPVSNLRVAAPKPNLNAGIKKPVPPTPQIQRDPIKVKAPDVPKADVYVEAPKPKVGIVPPKPKVQADVSIVPSNPKVQADIGPGPLKLKPIETPSISLRHPDIDKPKTTAPRVAPKVDVYTPKPMSNPTFADLQINAPRSNPVPMPSVRAKTPEVEQITPRAEFHADVPNPKVKPLRTAIRAPSPVAPKAEFYTDVPKPKVKPIKADVDVFAPRPEVRVPVSRFPETGISFTPPPSPELQVGFKPPKVPLSPVSATYYPPAPSVQVPPPVRAPPPSVARPKLPKLPMPPRAVARVDPPRPEARAPRERRRPNNKPFLAKFKLPQPPKTEPLKWRLRPDDTKKGDHQSSPPLSPSTGHLTYYPPSKALLSSPRLRAGIY